MRRVLVIAAIATLASTGTASGAHNGRIFLAASGCSVASSGWTTPVPGADSMGAGPSFIPGNDGTHIVPPGSLSGMRADDQSVSQPSGRPFVAMRGVRGAPDPVYTPTCHLSFHYVLVPHLTEV